MKRIVSFGDSFVAGLGTDRNYDESQLGNHPKWKEFTENEKNEARTKVNKFRRENSFTKYFADYYGVDYYNGGSIGCDNKMIVDSFFRYQDTYGFKKGDLVLFGFTSSLRDRLPWMPEIFNDHVMSGVTWSMKEIGLVATGKSQIVWGNGTYKERYDEFFHNYLKHYVTNLYDEKYFKIYNLNLISVLQHYLDYLNVEYIMFDAFEPMFADIPKHINTKHYWECGKQNIWSYLKTFDDEDLFELDGYSINKLVAKHPSRKGHKLFAKELYRFYNESR